MDKKTTKAKPSNVTTAKLILIGVLAVVLMGILYVQFGRARSGQTVAKASAALHEKPDQKNSAMQTSQKQSGQSGTARRAIGGRSRWQSPDLAQVVQYDPFALPAAFPQPVRSNFAGSQFGDGAATPEDVAKQQAATADTRKQMQDQFEALRRQGVRVIVKGRDEYVAVVGDKEVRVGDEINGFKVLSIDSDGVQVAWDPNE